MTTQSEQVPSCSASKVLKQLAEHYCQDIHEVKEEPPYFDFKDQHSQTPVLSSIDAHWLECLCSLASFDVAVEYICGYAAFIRPRLVNDEVGSISLLQHYELVLCLLIERLHTIVGFSLSESDSQQLWQQLRVLSGDIFALTSAPKVVLTPYIRSNIAIPTLRRLQHHVLHIFVSGDCPRIAPFDLGSLAGCAVSLLISSNLRLDPSLIASMLTDEDQFNLKNICAVPPDSRVSKEVSQLFMIQSMDWSTVSMDANLWNDGIVGVQTRSADVVWMDILQLLGNMSSTQVTEAVDVLPQDQRQRQQYVIKSLGMRVLSSEIRSMFFARDEKPFEPSGKHDISTYVMLGKRATKTQPIDIEKPYRKTPSRAYAALVFCLLFSVEKEEDCEQLVSCLLPVYLELVDSPDSTFCCLGVSALRLLLAIAGKKRFWLQYEEHCVAALDAAFTTQRNGPALILLGQTQRCLFECIPNASPRRKQTTRQWLLRLRQISLGPCDDFSVGDLLVGGIIPLLFQHAKLTNADAIELGRIGLGAILPLLVSEVTERKTFALLFVALINLLAGAYPVMALHEGKIMAHLLAATTKLKTYRDSAGCSVFALGLHTAALAHVIGTYGLKNDTEKSFLDSVEQNSETYQAVLLEVVKEIREYVANLEHNSNKEGLPNTT